MRRWVPDTRDVLAMMVSGLIALALVVMVVVSLLLCMAGIGFPLLDRTVRAIRRNANRCRLRVGVPAPYPALPERLPARLRAVAGDTATWRDMAWHLASGVILLPVAVVVIGLWVWTAAGLLGPVLLAVGPSDETLKLNGRVITGPAQAWSLVLWAAGVGVLTFFLQRLLVSAERWSARSMLRPIRRAVLAGWVSELTDNRADVLETWDAELHRIERDLHDGAQAQLTALTLNLGLAEQLAGADEQVGRLVADARVSASRALEGLREVVHGIRPPVLAERGLYGGLEELALATAVPVRVRAEVPRILPATVESALYFTAAELITNAVRHSGCDHIDLGVIGSDDQIWMTVRDNGAGGAVPRPGGGLEGLRRRLAVLGGQITVDSPADGPTKITVTVPSGR